MNCSTPPRTSSLTCILLSTDPDSPLGETRQSGGDSVVDTGRDIRNFKEDEITGRLLCRGAETTSTREDDSPPWCLDCADDGSQSARSGRL